MHRLYLLVDDPEDPLAFRRMLEKARDLDLSGIDKVGERVVSDSTYEMPDEVKLIDLDNVQARMKVQGYDLKEPDAPDPEAVSKALKKSDPTGDYKRNRGGYKVICPVCNDTHKCQNCKGRGRVKLILKCKVCMGTGKCQGCDRENDVTCPQCKTWISQYSDVCKRCGLSFRCPACGSTMPAMGTRCLSCKAEFKCSICGKPYPRQFSWRCPHCAGWNER
jgi:RecJ-like exonuclease